MMVKPKRIRVSITSDEISASHEALDALLRIPPPPPRETITLAKAIEDLAPKILALLDAGHNIETIAERVRLGGRPMLAAALKRYLAARGGRRSKSKGRRTKGTTPAKRQGGQSDELSSPTIPISGDPSPSNGSPIAATSSKPASTTQTPAMGGIPVQPDISRPITETYSVQQSRPAPAPLAQSVIPAKPTQSAEVTRSAAHPITSHNPMPAPLVRETSVPVSTSRAPTSSSAASMPERIVGIRNQPSLDLRLAAAARMDRAPPPGFEPHPIPQPGNNPTEKEDPPF